MRPPTALAALASLMTLAPARAAAGPPRFIGLGHLPGGASSLARDVSADGLVVVGLATPGYQAFRWTAAGGMIGLASPPTIPHPYIAYGVSADGAVVVGRGLAPEGGQAFQWTEAGGVIGVHYPNFYYAAAYGVSADGTTVVGQYSVSAFRWSQAGGVAALPHLPGYFKSWALAVSGDGSVIVGVSEGNSGFDTFLWTEALGTVSLRNHLISLGATGLEDWKLNFAGGLSISPDGRFIVGTGISPLPSIQAWLADLGTPCYADCTNDNALTVADFGCFQTLFVAGSPWADCDGDAALTASDFGCFQAKFVAGCP